MSTIIESLEQRQLRQNVPRFKAGDTVRVHFQVIEGQRRRVQVFEGIVIKRQGSGVRETFTVRKQSFGVGVERTFPVHSPKIEKIEVAAIGDVKRAKLYYLRDKVGKKARVRELRPAPGTKSIAATEEAPTVTEPADVEQDVAPGTDVDSAEVEPADVDAAEEPLVEVDSDGAAPSDAEREPAPEVAAAQTEQK